MFILRYKNRVIETESEQVKERYLKNGYDLIGKKGKVIEPATGGKTYTASQYNKLVAENAKLKEDLKKAKKA